MSGCKHWVLHHTAALTNSTQGQGCLQHMEHFLQGIQKNSLVPTRCACPTRLCACPTCSWSCTMRSCAVCVLRCDHCGAGHTVPELLCQCESHLHHQPHQDPGGPVCSTAQGTRGRHWGTQGGRTSQSSHGSSHKGGGGLQSDSVADGKERGNLGLRSDHSFVTPVLPHVCA